MSSHFIRNHHPSWLEAKVEAEEVPEEAEAVAEAVAEAPPTIEAETTTEVLEA